MSRVLSSADRRRDDTCAGASMLCYAIPPQWGEVYVLLGKERALQNWHEGSSKWSDFGGGRNASDESAEETAAREFVEETMAVVRYFPHDTLPRTTHKDIADSLTRGEYTFKFYVRYKSHRRKRRPFVVFFKQIPWDPACADRFATTRLHLLHANAHWASFEWMRYRLHLHPAVRVCAADDDDARAPTKSHTTTVPPRVCLNYVYLEKTRLCWWSLRQLQTAVECNGELRPGEWCRQSFLHFLPMLLREINV